MSRPNRRFSNDLIISKFGELSHAQIENVILEYENSSVSDFKAKYNHGLARKFFIERDIGPGIPALAIVSACLIKFFPQDFAGMGPGTFRGEEQTVKGPLERKGFIVAAHVANPIKESILAILDLQLDYKTRVDETPMVQRGEQLKKIEDELRSRFDPWEVDRGNGDGNAAKVPWVRIFNRSYSPTPTAGWYIVLLFSENGERVCLSLNQGVKNLIQRKSKLQAKNVREGLLKDEVGILLGAGFSVDLSLGESNKAKQYRSANVLAKTYEKSNIPADDDIVEDIEDLIPLLKSLYENKNQTVVKPTEKETLMSKDEDFVALCDEILMAQDHVLEIIDGLMDGTPQIILTGPPGTGKTWVASKIARYILAKQRGVRYSDVDENAARIVQFHPSYGYEEFVEGLRPKPAGNGFEFTPEKGVILKIAEAAEGGVAQVLIIDEINRANIPRVLGELMYLLEYREKSVVLQYGGAFKLPKNLFIIATMNNSDRSVRTIDLALRRRFDFFELKPDMTVLKKFYAKNPNEFHENELWGGLDELNKKIEKVLGERHFAVGHSYLMRREGMTRQALRKIWKQQIFPLIEDYFYDQPAIAETFELGEFWPSMGRED